MIELNSQNGADQILRFVQRLCLKEFPKEQLVGVEMGIAYGGGVEALGKIWGSRGHVYGYDTFEGHPKQLASSPDSFEATCMEEHYEKHGKEALSYEYQRAELDRQGLDNVILVQGLVDSDCCWAIPYIHYCLLDLDILLPMKDGYEAVRHKIVNGGYLCLHDVVGHKSLPELHAWYEDIKIHPQWEVMFEGEKEYLAILRRIR